MPLQNELDSIAKRQAKESLPASKSGLPDGFVLTMTFEGTELVEQGGHNILAQVCMSTQLLNLSYIHLRPLSALCQLQSDMVVQLQLLPGKDELQLSKVCKLSFHNLCLGMPATLRRLLNSACAKEL